MGKNSGILSVGMISANVTGKKISHIGPLDLPFSGMFGQAVALPSSSFAADGDSGSALSELELWKMIFRALRRALFPL